MSFRAASGMARVALRASAATRATPSLFIGPQVARVPTARSFSQTLATFDAKRGAWADAGPISYDEIKPWTEQPSGDINIIDVREPSETAQGMIPSAVNVPLSQFNKAFNPNSDSSEATDFERHFSFPRPGFDHKIAFYCRSGKRSEQAANIARDRGWHNVRNYTGSYEDWLKHKKEIPEEDE